MTVRAKVTTARSKVVKVRPKLVKVGLDFSKVRVRVVTVGAKVESDSSEFLSPSVFGDDVHLPT